MSRLWALYGATSREVLSYGGRAIVHGNRAELEFLFPGCRVVECPPDLAETGLPLHAHPDMAAVTFPLDRRQFT